MLFKIVLLLLTIAFMPGAEASGPETSTFNQVELGLRDPVGQTNAVAALGCHVASTCVVPAILANADVALQRVLLPQRFLLPSELTRPSRRLPVDLPPPRLTV